MFRDRCLREAEIAYQKGKFMQAKLHTSTRHPFRGGEQNYLAFIKRSVF
jgi:hypothetical protein